MAESTEKVTDMDLDEYVKALEGRNCDTEIELASIETTVVILRGRALHIPLVINFMKEVVIDQLGIESLNDESLQTFAKQFREEPEKVLDLVYDNFDRAVGLIASLSSLTTDQVKNLPLDEFSYLVFCEWKLNESFFTQRIASLFDAILPQTPPQGIAQK